MAMLSELADFLAHATPQTTQDMVWGESTLLLQIAAYVDRRQPPLATITSPSDSPTYP
jgi:hypothetical protein